MRRKANPGVPVAAFSIRHHPNAEAAARKHAAELNGETTEPEKWWVTDVDGTKKKEGPFANRATALEVRAYVEDATTGLLLIKSDSELKEDK